MPRRDEGRVLRALRPVEATAPVAIIDFLANAEAVLRRLSSHTCVTDWVLARRLRAEWIVLAASGDHGYRPGDALDRPEGAVDHLEALSATWTSDVVVDLDAGRVEPRRAVTEIPRLAGIAAFPLWGGDGVFGAICALPADAAEQAELSSSEPMVSLTVELLTSLLRLDLDRSRLQRRLDAAESAALTDALTNLGNRRAFDRAIAREEARCARFGHPAGVMVLDLDGLKDVNDTRGHEAGDDMIRRAAAVIGSTLRGADLAFRTGGDEFAVLLPEIDEDGVGALCTRLDERLREVGVAASIGAAVRRPAGNLHAVTRDADVRMYERKRERSGRTGGSFLET